MSEGVIRSGNMSGGIIDLRSVSILKNIIDKTRHDLVKWKFIRYWL